MIHNSNTAYLSI